MNTTTLPKTKTIERQLAHGASYLFIFKSTSQIISWAFTFLVARVLSPSDYGLMTMATTITSFAAVFSNLGLGSAIIQRSKCDQNELSSVFWFSIAVGCFIGIIAYFLAIPTSFMFHEEKVIPLTKAVAILFVIEGIQIVPYSLLLKELRFKDVGLIESLGVILSTIAIYVMAVMGFGVWSLLLGYILKSFFNLVFYFYSLRWKPILYFDFKIVKPFVVFGTKVMVANVLQNSISFIERFFTGRIWPITQFGQFGFAKDLSNLPSQRIVMLINQVSFSGFASVKDDMVRLQSMYLKIIQTIFFIVLPIFVGGFLLGDELIGVLLNPKWFPMTDVFRWFCILQIIISVSTINNSIHIAIGKPHSMIFYNVLIIAFLIVTLFTMLSTNINSIIFPYFITYGLINIGWILYTLLLLKLSIIKYIKKIIHPIIGSVLLFIAISFLEKFTTNGVFTLFVKIIAGALVYVCYYVEFAKKEFLFVLNQFSRNKSK